MDQERFDNLTRRLSQATGRRQVLRSLGGGLLGLVAGGALLGRTTEAAPKRRRQGELCGPGLGNQCGEGLSCLDRNRGGVGRCGARCGKDLTYCPLDGKCFDPILDGCCTTADCIGAICYGGSCRDNFDTCTTTMDCVSGLECRNGVCYDPLRNFPEF